VARLFEELSAPSQADVLDVARRTAERIDKLLRANGRSLEPERDEPAPELVRDEPGLAACCAAAAQGLGVSGERAEQPMLDEDVIVEDDFPFNIRLTPTENQRGSRRCSGSIE
jgi:hypothetical protein